MKIHVTVEGTLSIEGFMANCARKWFVIRMEVEVIRQGTLRREVLITGWMGALVRALGGVKRHVTVKCPLSGKCFSARVACES